MQILALYTLIGVSCIVNKSVIYDYSPVAWNFMICDARLVCCHCYLRLLAVIFNPTKLLCSPLCSLGSARILLSSFFWGGAVFPVILSDGFAFIVVPLSQRRQCRGFAAMETSFI